MRASPLGNEYGAEHTQYSGVLQTIGGRIDVNLSMIFFVRTSTAPGMSKNSVVGVSDHGGWAVFVTVASDGTLLDRRRVELVDANLPKIPHHSEGQRLPPERAVALVERVRASAEKHSVLALDAVSASVPDVSGIALRQCPPLPPTIEERLKDYRAQNVADWVMYRQALASAAEARGWPVHWFDSKKVFDAAREVLGVDDIDAHFLDVRRTIGAPWNQDHKLAMAAAVATGSRAAVRQR